MSKHYDYIIIGSGIIGLSIAHALKRARPERLILVLDKEDDTARHASGRNSGVLHAGFYYTADSLKAKFTVEGNKAMRAYCQEHGLPINPCGKLVVAQNEEELAQLSELELRGRANGSRVSIISEQEAKNIEPNVRTYKKALHSPDTASIDPVAVCQHLKGALQANGVYFSYDTKCLKASIVDQTVLLETTRGTFPAKRVINAAGLYADTIAHQFGFGQAYTLIPFKGLYLKYTKNTTDVRVNIYPVPNLKNPFLGVHFTKTVSGEIKIGPTAIPAWWREQYAGWENVNLKELFSITALEARLWLKNTFGFRDLAKDEFKKYNRDYFINLACHMVQSIDKAGFTSFTKPGIRAQLVNKQTGLLVQDFVVEGDRYSTHVLNAVSPAFTCAFPFAEYVVREYVKD